MIIELIKKKKKSTPQKFCQKSGLSKQEISTLPLQYQKKASTLCCHTLLYTFYMLRSIDTIKIVKENIFITF